MALYQFEEVLRTLRSELKEKFIALYFTRKSQSIYDREIDSLAHLLVVLKEQNEKGNVSLLEKSRIEALLLSLRQERNDIANQVISLQGDMRLLLGISGKRQGFGGGREITTFPRFPGSECKGYV